MSTRSPSEPRRARRWYSRVFSLELRWTQFDWHVLLIAAGLLCVGLLFLHAMSEADARYERVAGPDFESHLQKLAVALPCFLAGLLLRPRWLHRRAWLLYGLSIALLALVPILGQERNHARRWISLPIGFDLQPSELAKVALIVVLARVFYRNRLESVGDWLKPAALVLLPMALVARQPDLGTALAMAPIALGMFYLSGARKRALLLLCLGGIGLFALACRFQWIHSYQLQRVDTWLSTVSAEPLIEGRNSTAFHIYHARVAIGNGGWLGTGLGLGVANQAAHLPERDCDSIFAVLSEEGGLLGAGVLLLLYVLLCAGLLQSAGLLRDRFSRLVVGGVGLYFASHLFIHTGVNLGLLPLTGLPLPLFSTGGSSMLASFAALGLALGLAARREPSLDEDSFRE